MAVKKKKIGSAGRFGAGYGKIKQKLIAVEKKQRIRQDCPFCKGRAKRQAKAIWLCSKCGKRFAGGVFHLKSL
jgi:ribosomal protein L37AE/L43A